jgi:hypothetical protein
MVKTSVIQERLRHILYGFKSLPIPARFRPIIAKALSEAASITSRKAVRAVIDMQTRIEFSSNISNSVDPFIIKDFTLEDCQDGTCLWSRPEMWNVGDINGDGTYSSASRWSEDSVLALCSEDMVLAEAE